MIARLVLPFALCALIGACAPTPATHTDNAAQPLPSSPAAQDAALTALTLIGTPYRYGGASPSGFDCSGLVQYSYAIAGLKVPRDTKQQRTASKKLAADESLAPGDLLFFNIGSPASLHVGLFVGEGKFVHAPAQGGRVRIERLQGSYWQRYFLEARRL